MSSSSNVFAIPEKIAQHTSNNPFIAFEYYPPRTESGVNALEKRMERMKQLGKLNVF